MNAAKRFVFVILIFLLLSIGMTPAMAADTPKQCPLIKIGINTDITASDPHVSGATVNSIVLGHCVERLVAYGGKMEILPELAESWETSDDLKTYTFKLRKGRKFHNGREMVADDVKYSMERIMDPKTKNPRAKLLTGLVESVEVVDPYTVRFKLKRSSASLLHILAYTSPVMAVVPKEEIEKQGGVFNHPIGTGPYKFVEWKPDRYILLEKFEDYVPYSTPRNGASGAKIAYADKIKFIPIGEESASIMALLNKEIDILQYYPPKMFKKFKSNYEKRGLEMQEITGLSWYQIWFGLGSPVVDNLKFRQACAYAIDLEMVTRAAHMGHAKVNPSMLAVGSEFYSPVHAQWYKKDPEKAKQLLKEAGYNGEKVVIDCTKKYAAMYRQAVAVQAELQAVGINAKLNVLEWPILLSKFYKGQYQIASFGISARPDLAVASIYFDYNKLNEKYPKMKNLMAEASRTLDNGKRKMLFEEMHKFNKEVVGFINFYNYNYLQVNWNYVKGYETISTGYPRLWGVWLDK
jgi:peptide/nickel transport system substrate-binding protein